jgi:hypothetical protein
LRFKSPKTERARVITLPAFAIDELHRLKRQQAEEQQHTAVICEKPSRKEIRYAAS